MGRKKKDVVEAETPATVAHPETAATLYFNRNGSVECEEHAPRPGTQTWRLDNWRKMTPPDVEALEREFGRKIACVTCAQPKATGAASPAEAEPAAPKRKAKNKEAEQAPTLLWNERGQVGCTLPGHAPAKGTDSWKFEHWKKIPEGAAKEDGQPFRCETCNAGERAPEIAPSAEASPAPERKGSDLMLIELALKYVKHMEKAGKSSGTIASYQMELKTALDHFGAETKVADLTPEKVLAYFASDRVMKKRNGRGKSPLSFAKTQRVLRLALVWAAEKKLIEKAPLPETLATH